MLIQWISMQHNLQSQHTSLITIKPLHSLFNFWMLQQKRILHVAPVCPKYQTAFIYSFNHVADKLVANAECNLSIFKLCTCPCILNIACPAQGCEGAGRPSQYSAALSVPVWALSVDNRRNTHGQKSTYTYRQFKYNLHVFSLWVGPQLVRNTWWGVRWQPALLSHRTTSTLSSSGHNVVVKIHIISYYHYHFIFWHFILRRFTTRCFAWIWYANSPQLV